MDGTMGRQGRQVPVWVAAAALLAACTAELEGAVPGSEGSYMDRALSAEQRLRLLAEANGFDPADAVFHDGRLVVEGDIAFGAAHLAALDGELELPETGAPDDVQKGYHRIFGVVSPPFRRVCLVVDSSGDAAVDKSWHDAFYYAAIELNRIGSTLRVVDIDYAPDTSGCPSGSWPIHIHEGALVTASGDPDPVPIALGEWPLVAVTGPGTWIAAPGREITINTNAFDYPSINRKNAQRHVALHELAHNLGVDHWDGPGTLSAWIPLSCQSTQSTCDSVMSKKVDTNNSGASKVTYGSDDRYVMGFVYGNGGP